MTRPEDQHLINNSSNACRRVLAISACSILLALGMGRLQAQQDTLTGVVLDQSGQAIANAAGLVKNAEGRFEVSGLPSGVYTVDVSATGFAPVSRAGLQVPSTQELSISLGVAT